LELNLAGQTAVIVGGAKGIGHAIAEAFSAEGVHVELLDIDPNVEKSATALAGRTGHSTCGRIADATDYSALQGLAQQIAEERPGPLHLVYAAGCGSGKYGFPFWNLSPDDWGRVLQVNLIGAVNAAHSFAPHWVNRQAGTMLLLSSIAGQIGSQTDPPYSAAKAGLINFAQCSAKDLAPLNVRVNVICPGMVKTDVNRSVWQAWHDQQAESDRLTYEEWAGEKAKRVAPLGRWQTVEDIAALAVFLASERAHNITGQTMNVDGGQVMHW
jgi:2-hydroxycyclohexanecarboxyl-CoA dehydrogenase